MVRFKFKTVIFLFFVSFSSFAYEWQNKGKELKEPNLIASNVMVGDSITQMGPWQDLLSNADIVNRGVAGDTSALILNRMDGILSVKPKKAFLMFGINDFLLGADVNQVFHNYEKIITILHNAGVRLIISSTIQCNTNLIGTRDKIINKKVEALNSRLKRFSEANGIKFIDINEKLSNANGLNEKYTTDGVHLNLNGYKEWAKLLSSFANEKIR